ncbi:hypothetical protein KKP04_01050 [Rhodomicrobium sp. Az07]|uniref:hypothetical protein n=1 Tax=Rhodomicrobium sp. Az07 TaxID=2839034 RepID=UPI001BE7F231|nr:hypothetical protein [Rhodomicrobium sp. Az07]MBT3069457.1 hypothetical protein [Rhodomicrobium sp. Az07]
MRDVSNREAMIEAFRKDPDLAVEIVAHLLEAGDVEAALSALNTLFASLGDKTENVQRPTPLSGSATVVEVAATLRAMGLRLSVQPLH